jgi:hypothetical protein
MTINFKHNAAILHKSKSIGTPWYLVQDQTELLQKKNKGRTAQHRYLLNLGSMLFHNSGENELMKNLSQFCKN